MPIAYPNKANDSNLADEWNQVMFTHGKEFDVFHNHHLLVVLVEDRIVQHFYIDKNISIRHQALGSGYCLFQKIMTTSV